MATPQVGHVTFALHSVAVSQESPEAALLYGLYLFSFAKQELVCSMWWSGLSIYWADFPPLFPHYIKIAFISGRDASRTTCTLANSIAFHSINRVLMQGVKGIFFSGLFVSCMHARTRVTQYTFYIPLMVIVGKD